jgi:hypothetical protein
MTKSEARDIIVKCVQLYKNNLCDKELIFVYFLNAQIHYVRVVYRVKNYKHLTGVVSDYTPKKFFEVCYNKKISQNEISFKENGTTLLKLEILERMMNIIEQVKFIGDYLNTNVYLGLDKVVGNVFAGLGIEKGSELYFPKSILRGDMRKQIYNMAVVSAVLEKPLQELNAKYKIVKIHDNLTKKQEQSIQSFLCGINSARGFDL